MGKIFLPWMVGSLQGWRFPLILKVALNKQTLYFSPMDRSPSLRNTCWGKIAQALDAKKRVVLEKIPEGLAGKLPLDRVEILQEDDPVSVTKPQMQDPEIRTIPVPSCICSGDRSPHQQAGGPDGFRQAFPGTWVRCFPSGLQEPRKLPGLPYGAGVSFQPGGYDKRQDHPAQPVFPQNLSPG